MLKNFGFVKYSKGRNCETIRSAEYCRIYYFTGTQYIYLWYLLYEQILNVQVRYLEHVQCRISLKYFPRGQLHILLRFAQHRSYLKVVHCVIIILPCANAYSITLLLRSPRGTQSFLLLTRPKDRQASGILYSLTWSLKILPYLSYRCFVKTLWTFF